MHVMIVARTVRIAVDVAREPAGLGIQEVLRGPVRIHSGHDEDAVLMRGASEFAEQVATIQKLRAMLERELARVVRHDAARIDNHRLDLRGFPI